MRWSFSGLMVGVIVSALPVQAQAASNAQVSALVEALRLAAPKTGIQNDGLYSDWQILPGNIPRWSKQCTGRALSVAEFESSPSKARQVVDCVMKTVLRDEYRASGNRESVAVRRAAAWWMTGDPSRYSSDRTGAYTQKVLGFYRQQLGSGQTAQAARQQSPAPKPQVEQQQSDYDRYAQVGYAAAQKRDYQTALINFRKALRERPGDPYATRAIQQVERYIQQRPQIAAPAPSSAAPTKLTQQQAVSLINQWLEAKQQIFAPPFDRQLAAQLTSGDLYAELDKPSGAIAWLKNNNAYYRFGVQKTESVERFVASGNKATLELNVTEDRTLYRNGKVDPTQTDFKTRLVRYTLQSVDGKWKIIDYKTVDGSLLERAISN